MPALDLLDRGPEALAIVELSSYQIADLAGGPEVALITNLFREHTDWHGSEQRYRAEKLRILELPGRRLAVLPARQPELALGADARANAACTATRRAGIVADGAITFAGDARGSRRTLPLPGEHNALNLCAALTALEAAGVQLPALPGALAGFEGLAHRLQTVAESGGLRWVDDTISTTPESALAALASFPACPSC